ncbi:MAG: asparagine synthase (glutamine-hydrolyzing) [Candidatus Taylorbacteria bacterium]|nr:asparagine synthase (glutamine-hydrolyzing) [Candidatus Taylorbacteria bacterium]
MCGITGFVGKGDEETIKRMTSTIAHRGPNDETFFHSGETHFGFRRLSIIDIEGGRQPVWNENKTVVAIFNGEIYNFESLRNELQAKGHTLISKSDTEVIVHLYEEEGENLFSKLNGMFAIALWDITTNKLLLARDRLGKKPLYYALVDNTLIFGSEPKALLAHPSIKKELDIESLNLYLEYEFVPSPRSIYKNIFKLEPGSYLTYKNQNLEIKSFWNLDFTKKTEQTEIENMKQLNSLIKEAVSIRLTSDVPLGVYLSGGLDSSIIAWYASKKSSKPLETFTVSFAESGFDESGYARTVANLLKTNHHEERLTATKALSYLEKAVEIFDEPLSDASILPNLFLAEWSKQHITVALGGDGGDELFLGYQNIQAHSLNRLYKKIPGFIRHDLIEPLVRKLPSNDAYFSFPFKSKRFIKGAGKNLNDFEQDLAWRGSFSNEDKKFLLSENFNTENIGAKELERHITDSKTQDFFERLTYLYLKQYLADDILVKVDRSSMAFGQEVRAPLLDYRIVEFAANLPTNLKFKNLKGKYLLKKIMRGRLPDEILDRPKKGFGVPIAEWLRGDLKPIADKYFSEAHLKTQGIFNHQYVRKLYADHLAKRADYRKELWTLLVFQLWYNRWIS